MPPAGAAPPRPGLGPTISVRRGLPGSRAVVGGLLVALAAIGTWVAVSGAGRSDHDRYLVAARPIGPGQRIEADDLRWAAIALPDSLRTRAFADDGGILGSVALGPIDAGELIQAGAIAPPAGSPTAREISFSVEIDWAVAGTLRPGDRIDVFATQERTEGATSERVLSDATIRRVATSGGEGLGASRSQTITVAVEGTDLIQDLVTATRSATVTVVRVTGTAADPSASTSKAGQAGG